MKSIIILLFLLLISFLAYINQDAILDRYMNSTIDSEVNLEQLPEQESEPLESAEIKSESPNQNLDNFQTSQNLDEDFQSSVKQDIELDSQDDSESEINPNDNQEISKEEFSVENNNSDQINRSLNLQRFESELINFTYSEGLEFRSKTPKSIEIFKDENLVGAIVIDSILEGESIENYFKNASFDLITEASNQGIYPKSFNQSFSSEALEFNNFVGISNFDYFVIREPNKISILYLETKYVDTNFREIVLSSINLK